MEETLEHTILLCMILILAVKDIILLGALFTYVVGTKMP